MSPNIGILAVNIRFLLAKLVRFRDTLLVSVLRMRIVQAALRLLHWGHDGRIGIPPAG